MHILKHELRFIMEKYSIELCFEYKKTEELSPIQRKIAEAAYKACDSSYSPYSKFAVGAAVETDSGEIFHASNQENAAYPSGLCAERNILFYIKSLKPENEIIRMAIAAKNDGKLTKKPVSPCGACRQVMTETAKRQKNKIELIMVGTDICIIVKDVNDLLPLQFNADNEL